MTARSDDLAGDSGMKNRRLLLGSLCAVTVIIGAGIAHAQTINYGAMEELMGAPITTSATGTPQLARDVAANMTIITADEIRQSGARNVAAVLTRVPGLDILRTSSTVYDVGVRGYQQSFQPRLLVLLDGRQVFLDGFSRTSWDNLPVNIDDIRQIEVVKGASSALFGSNAAGAVVNIITYNPLYDNNRVASATLGTQFTREGDATLTQKLGDWGGVKFSAGGLIADEFNVPRPATEARITKDPYKGYLTTDSLFQLAPNLQTNFAATYSRNRADTGNIQTVVSTNETTTFSFRGGVQWDTDYGAIKMDNYWNHLHLQPNPPGGGPCACFTNNLIVSHLEDQFRPSPDHTFRVALEYRHKDVEIGTSPLIAFPQSPALDYNVYTTSGTWLWQLNDKLSWTNAARFDYETIQQTGMPHPFSLITASDDSHALNAFSANSGFAYRMTDLDTFRLIYGRGVLLPGVLENGFSNTQLSPSRQVIDIEGNPNVKPTIVSNYEINYDRALPQIFSTAKFAGFYESNRDVRAPFQVLGQRLLANGTTVLLEEDINVGSSHGFGGELQLAGKHPNGMRWDTSYSYARAHDDPGVTNSGGFAGSTPAHHFRLLVGYTTGSWEFDGDGQLLTSRTLARTNVRTTTPGYTTLSGRIGYKLTDKMTVALTGTNLTQTNTLESAFPKIERQVFVTLTTRF
jgi:outer membrane receptor for ferrienterochelin and colicins